MLTQLVNLTVAMYEAIGPGLLFAASLPVLLILLGILVRAGTQRLRTD